MKKRVMNVICFAYDSLKGSLNLSIMGYINQQLTKACTVHLLQNLYKDVVAIQFHLRTISKKMSQILQEHSIIFMADEIQMGFYRTGKMWSFENFNIVPDIFTFGKAISNGIWPLSGVWAREDIISPEQWPCGSSHATFSGNPIAMSLGLTAMDLVNTPSFLEQIKHNEKQFSSIIAHLKKDYSIIGRADCCGMAAGLEIVDETTKRPDPELARKIAELALREPVTIDGISYGLILSIGGIFENAFLLSPNIIIQENELKLFDVIFRHYMDKSLKT